MAIPVGANRPATVPDDFLATPFGFFHPSCVASLAKGEKLLPDRRIVHADGSIESEARACNFPHFSATGKLARTAQKPSTSRSTRPDINGWLENANVTPQSSNIAYGALIAWWLVPPSPRDDDGQVLFFFPGLEDIDNPQTSILQPVLEWAGGQWSVAKLELLPQRHRGEQPGGQRLARRRDLWFDHEHLRQRSTELRYLECSDPRYFHRTEHHARRHA